MKPMDLKALTPRGEQPRAAVSGAGARRGAQLVRATLVGGSLVAVLDGLDAIAAFGLVLGLSPTQIYQFVASGMLGPEAYQGGAATALFGVAVHCLVAYSAAAVFAAVSLRYPAVLSRPAVWGSAFGVLVYAFMNGVVIPLSLIGPTPFSWPLFLNGVLGHAVLVGLPIAYSTRYYLGHASLASRGLGEPVTHPASL